MEKLSDIESTSTPSSITPESVSLEMKGQPNNIQEQMESNDTYDMYKTSKSNFINPGACEKDEAEVDQEPNGDKVFLFDTLHLINQIVQEIEVLRSSIEDFGGSSPEDKEYKYLEEMLIRGTVKLDDIETRENLLIRQERKRAVQYIQKLMRLLDARLKENVRNIYEDEISEDDV